MTTTQWFVSINGEQLEGWFTPEEIGKMYRNNPGAEFMVWKEGMEKWMDPCQLDDFQGVLSPPRVQETPKPPASPPTPGPSIRHPRPLRPGHQGQHISFFKALFDTKFDSFITPKIISILYIIVMILIGLGFLILVISGISSIFSGIRLHRGFMIFMGFFWLILSPILTVVYLAFTRMFFELVMVLFKIKENSDKMASR